MLSTPSKANTEIVYFIEISLIIKEQSEIIVSMHGIGMYLKDEYDGKMKCKNKRDSKEQWINVPTMIVIAWWEKCFRIPSS